MPKPVTDKTVVRPSVPRPSLVSVSFAPQEIIVLRNLIHVALKVEGMSAARACVALDEKLLAAARASERASPPSSD